MLQSHTFEEDSFKSNAEAIVSLIHSYHCSLSSHQFQQQVAIYHSLSIAHPLIIPIEEANENCIFIDNFLILLDKRLVQEKAYVNEITQLKNSFYEAFNELYSGIADRSLIKFIRHQQQRVIDYLFNCIKFEKCQLVWNFYNNMINGYDNEAMGNFEEIVYKVLWKPLMTPVPLGLIEMIQNEFDKVQSTRSKQNFEEIVSKLILYVKEYLETKTLKLSAMTNIGELKNVLMQTNNAKKTCLIIVDTVDEEKFNLIQKFKEKCIKSIGINLNSDDFEMKKFYFAYDHLNLLTPIRNRKIRLVMYKLPKNLKSLTQRFAHARNFDLKILKCSLINLKSLRKLTFEFNDDDNCISDAGMVLVAQIIDQNKQISKLNLQFESDNNNITDTGLNHLLVVFCKLPKLIKLKLSFGGQNTAIIGEGGEILAKFLQEREKMNYLHLNFTNSSFTTDAINKLAISLGSMHELIYLYLAFGGDGNNSANNYSMQLFGQSIKTMKNLVHLECYFWQSKHHVTDDGVVQLCQSIANLNSIQQLTFGFSRGNNSVSDKAIEEVGRLISNWSNLLSLDLRFFDGKHCIGDKGMQSLGNGLEANLLLKKLYLSFGLANNSVSDRGIEALSQSIAKLKFLQELTLFFPQGKNEVTDIGIGELSQSLIKLPHLEKLELKFFGGNHRISDRGLQALAAALKNIHNLSILDLEFNGGQNTISREGINFLAEALLALKPSLDFICYFVGQPNKVTQSDIEYLRKIRSYSYFLGH